MPRIDRLFRSLTPLILALAIAGLGPAGAVAQAAKFLYANSTPFSGFNNAIGVAADSAGNFFIADQAGQRLYKETPNGDGTYTQSTITTSASLPCGVTVDSSNNLYVTGSGSTIYKETPSGGSYTESTVASGFSYACGLAVDGSGDVFVIDFNTGGVYEETLSGGSYTRSTVMTGLGGGINESGTGIAVDSSGNVYVADSGGNRVLKETPSGGTYTQSVLIDSSTINASPKGVAVDAAGNVFISYFQVNNAASGTYELPAGAAASSVQEISQNGASGYGMIEMPDQSIYIASGFQIDKLTPNQLAEDSGPVNFGATGIGTDGGTQTVTFTFDVAGQLASTPYAVSTQGNLSADFQAAATQPANVCVGGHNYVVGDTCSVTAHFSPTRPGTRYGAAVLFHQSGLPVGTAYLQGEGTGPQVSYAPGVFSPLIIGSSILSYDGLGNILYGGGFGNLVDSYNPGTRQILGVGTGFDTGYFSYAVNGVQNFGLSADGAGNILTSNIAQTSANVQAPGYQLWLQAYALNPNIAIPTGSDVPSPRYGLTPISILSTGANPVFTARPVADGSGNVYFSDVINNRVLKESWTHGSYSQLTVVADGFNNPGDVAVDGDGNVYVLDVGNSRVVKETLSNGTYTDSTIIDSLNSPRSLAIDRLGNLYITLDEVSPPTDPAVIKLTLVNGSYQPGTIAAEDDGDLDVDVTGNVVTGNTETGAMALLDVADAQPLQFKSTAVGTKSSDSPQIVTIVNNGNADLIFSAPASGSNPAITSGFTLDSSSTCPILSTSSSTATVAAGASCTLAVNFIPVQSGANHGTLTLTDNHLNAPGSTQVIPLNGNATGTATVSATLTPAPYDYGSVNVGASATQVFTLTNTGTASITIASASLPNPVFTISSSNCTTTLAAGRACTYTVAFAPTAAGAQTTVFSVGYASTSVTASLSGTGVVATTSAPQAALTPATADFGSVTAGSTSAAQTFKLSNAGTAALPITSIGLTGMNAGSFAVTGGTCGTSLAAGGSCTITVMFSPAAAGSFSASLSVTDSVGTQTSVLSGTGVAAVVSAPKAALTPATADFGSINVGSTSTSQTFTLANAGTAALPITSIGVTGANASAFTIGANTCGTSLAAGGSCTITITFSPTAAGSDTASLTVVDSVGTQSSALTGTAVAVVTAAPDFTIAATPPTQSASAGASVTYTVQLGSVDSTNPFTSAVTLSETGLPVGATANFSPASVVPGSSPSTMTVILASPTAAGIGSTRPQIVCLSLASITLVFITRRRSRRRMLQLTALAILAVAAMTTTLTGCGNKTGFAISGSTSPGSTTSTITITGTSGSTTHSTTVTLTVQQ